MDHIKHQQQAIDMVMGSLFNIPPETKVANLQAELEPKGLQIKPVPDDYHEPIAKTCPGCGMVNHSGWTCPACQAENRGES